MKRPQPGGTALLITVSSEPGKYEDSHFFKNFRFTEGIHHSFIKKASWLNNFFFFLIGLKENGWSNSFFQSLVMFEFVFEA